jgi:hypothetical protein
VLAIPTAPAGAPVEATTNEVADAGRGGGCGGSLGAAGAVSVDGQPRRRKLYIPWHRVVSYVRHWCAGGCHCHLLPLSGHALYLCAAHALVLTVTRKDSGDRDGGAGSTHSATLCPSSTVGRFALSHSRRMPLALTPHTLHASEPLARLFARPLEGAQRAHRWCDEHEAAQRLQRAGPAKARAALSSTGCASRSKCA